MGKIQVFTLLSRQVCFIIVDCFSYLLYLLHLIGSQNLSQKFKIYQFGKSLGSKFKIVSVFGSKVLDTV